MAWYSIKKFGIWHGRELQDNCKTASILPILVFCPMLSNAEHLVQNAFKENGYKDNVIHKAIPRPDGERYIHYVDYNKREVEYFLSGVNGQWDFNSLKVMHVDHSIYSRPHYKFMVGKMESSQALRERLTDFLS